MLFLKHSDYKIQPWLFWPSTFIVSQKGVYGGHTVVFLLYTKMMGRTPQWPEATVVGIDVSVRYAHFNWSCLASRRLDGYPPSGHWRAVRLLAKRMSFLEAPEVRGY